MKLKQDFITQDFHGVQMLVAVGKEARRFHGLVRSNETAAFIVDCLKRETTETQIVDALLEEYDVDRPTAERDVRNIIDKLEGIGALE